MRFCYRKGLGRCAALAFVSLILMPLGAQEGRTPAGDPAIAAAYVDTALKAIDNGEFLRAESILSRGTDFAESSSDVSYLLALIRGELGRPVPDILDALRLARSASRWQRYSPDSARMVESEVLLRLHDFDGALTLLAPLPLSPGREYARLRALAVSGDQSAYLSAMARSLEAWPTDTRFVRILFRGAVTRRPSAPEQGLVERTLKRLTVLLEHDPSLAGLAVPFIRDGDEARRLVSAWRAEGRAGPASLQPALSLGLISDEVAISELFTPVSQSVPLSIRTDILRGVWGLLRSDASRELFLAELAAFSGTLSQDSDGDGFVEALVRYSAGKIVFAAFDSDQDGVDEMTVTAVEGLPIRAEILFYPDRPSHGRDIYTRYAAPPSRASVEWNQFPYVSGVTDGATRWEISPMAFPWAPVTLDRLVLSPTGPVIRYPRLESPFEILNERTLVSFASTVERPGTIARGSIERVEIASGLPVRSVETLDGRIIAIRQFRNGKLLSRSLDLDSDGRMETSDRFTPGPASPSWLEAEGTPSIRECDWDGDGLPEYAERLLEDGKIERSWDMDHDGKRERKEIGN